MMLPPLSSLPLALWATFIASEACLTARKQLQRVSPSSPEFSSAPERVDAEDLHKLRRLRRREQIRPDDASVREEAVEFPLLSNRAVAHCCDGLLVPCIRLDDGHLRGSAESRELDDGPRGL